MDQPAMPRAPSRARFLASVRNAEEARLCVAHGADLIDCKEPSAGALGALPAATIQAIRRAVPPAIPVSATIGDEARSPEAIAGAAAVVAATGIEFVKIGLWGMGARGIVEYLAARDFAPASLIAVLIADDGLDIDLIPALRTARFAGVMLDTADKAGGALPERIGIDRLAKFVRRVQGNGMLAGLAGSLAVEHVASLLGLGPDVLGFRGGLCRKAERRAALDAAKIRAVRAAFDTDMPMRAAG